MILKRYPPISNKIIKANVFTLKAIAYCISFSLLQSFIESNKNDHHFVTIRSTILQDLFSFIA